MSNNNSGKVEEIKEAVRDGLANHSGEFANPWIFKGSYSHELLADILNDIMASERIFKNLDKLISSKVNEARIDELERHISWNHPAGGITLTRQEVDDRIRTLKKTGGADEQEQ